MNNPPGTVDLATTGAGIALSLFFCLLFVKRANRTGSVYLLLFFFASMLSQLDEWFWLTESWRSWPLFSQAYLPFLYLLAPCFYLYIVSITTADDKPKFALLGKHWIGFVLSFICVLPYLTLDTGTKLSRLEAPAGSLQHLHIYTWGPTLALAAVVPFSLFYLLLIAKQLKVHQRSLRQLFSNLEDRNLLWVFVLLMLLLAGLVVSSIRLFLPNNISEVGGVKTLFLLFECLWLMLLGLFAVEQQPIYRDASDQSQYRQLQQSAQKYQRSGLTESDAERIADKLNQAMQAGLFRDPDLTLAKLSAATSVTGVNISQVLNTHMNTGFYDYVNRYRIENACDIMARENKTVLDIALQVGFNSRSTFNLAFKKVTGTTPSQYRRQI